MSSAVSTTDTGLEEALGSLQFVSPDIASLRTCTCTKSSIVRLHLGQFAYFQRRCQAYGKRFHAVHANTRDTAQFEHTWGSNEWNADFAYLFETKNGRTGAAGCDVMGVKFLRPYVYASGPLIIPCGTSLLNYHTYTPRSILTITKTTREQHTSM